MPLVCVALGGNWRSAYLVYAAMPPRRRERGDSRLKLEAVRVIVKLADVLAATLGGGGGRNHNRGRLQPRRRRWWRQRWQ
jgi:hypothetical protein